MNLQSLPPEILSRILVHLPQDSIFNLSKTSIFFKSICYTNIYGTLYIIISTDCRLYEFIATKIDHSNHCTIISGQLQLGKFIVYTLLELKKYIKRLYIDFLSFDNLLDPRIQEMFELENDSWMTRNFPVKSYWHQHDTLEVLFARHVTMRLNRLDGWDVGYFDERILSSETKVEEIAYTSPISYGKLINNINDVYLLCEDTLNLIDYRIYYGWELKIQRSNRIIRVYQLIK